MHLGVLAVSSQIGGDTIDLVAYGLQQEHRLLMVDVRLVVHFTNSPAQHLVPFGDQVQLVLEILAQYADVGLEIPL